MCSKRATVQEAVTFIITQYPNDTTIQKLSLRVLAALTTSKQYKQKCLNIGVCRAVVAALKADRGDTDTLLAVLSVMNHMVEKTCALSDSITAQFSTEGACEAVALVLITHYRNVELTLRAGTTMKNLARNSTANITKLGDAGACEYIIVAMELHANCPGIQLIACEVIQCLASLQANKDKFSSAGACTVIVAVLRSYTSLIHIACAACAAIDQLCEEHQANKTELIAADAQRAINRALVDHRQNNAFKLQAVQALNSLK
jgi:hypothetical protein